VREPPFIIDDSILSPHVKIVLQNNLQAVTFMLCEQIIGTMNYSRAVLNYLLYDCIHSENNSSNTTTTNTAEAIFGGYLLKGGGGIAKWFNAHNGAARKQNGGRRLTRLHIPNSFIACLFQYITPTNQYLFHSCLQVYVHHHQRHLLQVLPPIMSVSTTPTTSRTTTSTTPTPTPVSESSDVDTTTTTTTTNKDFHQNNNAGGMHYL